MGRALKSADQRERRAGRASGADQTEEDLRAALSVAGSLDLGEQMLELLRHAISWGCGTIGFAFVQDDESGSLAFRTSTLEETDPRRGLLQRLDPALVWQCVGVEPTLFSGIARIAPGETAAGRALPGACLGIRVEGASSIPVGLLLLLGEEPPREQASRRLRHLLELTRPAFRNGIQMRAVRELVIKDDTAECFNRRHFEDFLADELSRASRFRAPLSLIFFDMDNLKEVNSRLGHAMGSRSLFEVSVRVRSRVRKFDKLFRFGGDEFCIVLPETEWHGALEVAERVRESIATKPFLEAQPGAKGGVRMTASFGIASFPLHARTKEDLVQRADRAMQRIKAGTKNSIAIAEIVKEDREP